jgi:hypothetical protein
VGGSRSAIPVSLNPTSPRQERFMTEKTRSRMIPTIVLIAVVSVASILSSGSSQGAPTSAKPAKEKVVYVCACLKTKSCSCMTEAKTKGPCACGTAGGPPMKPVPPDSDWAKENREALAN